MLGMADIENVLLNIQIPRTVRDEFKIAAKLKGSTMSASLYQHILQTIRQEKDASPQSFPDYVHQEKEVSARSSDRFREYAEAFDADDLSENEWQYLELYPLLHLYQWLRLQCTLWGKMRLKRKKIRE
jgi:hypothetical protein